MTMKISVRGKIPTAVRKDIRSCIQFIGDHLLGSKLSKNVSVQVVITKGLLKRDKVDAWCVWDDDNYRPRDFLIEMDSALIDDRRRLSRVLCHEMVHVRQYARSQLKDRMKGIMWKNRRVSEKTKYRDRPWEAEAFDLEEYLAEYWESYLRLRAKETAVSKN